MAEEKGEEEDEKERGKKDEAFAEESADDDAEVADHGIGEDEAEESADVGIGTTAEGDDERGPPGDDGGDAEVEVGVGEAEGGGNPTAVVDIEMPREEKELEIAADEGEGEEPAVGRGGDAEGIDGPVHEVRVPGEFEDAGFFAEDDVAGEGPAEQEKQSLSTGFFSGFGDGELSTAEGKPGEKNEREEHAGLFGEDGKEHQRPDRESAFDGEGLIGKKEDEGGDDADIAEEIGAAYEIGDDFDVDGVECEEEAGDPGGAEAGDAAGEFGDKGAEAGVKKEVDEVGNPGALAVEGHFEGEGEAGEGAEEAVGGTGEIGAGEEFTPTVDVVEAGVKLGDVDIVVNVGAGEVDGVEGDAEERGGEVGEVVAVEFHLDKAIPGGMQRRNGRKI